jgi:phosphatidylglycerophosphate synthase
MNIAQEYKKSLKLAEVEEILDLIFYRPIAFLFVKSIYRLPITPNQITYASLVAGLLSAFEFGQGTPNGFVWGAVWYATANVLDCGDGMLARLQNSGTPLGRLVDGLVDWISTFAILLGLAIGMSAYFGNPLYWLLVAAAGIVSGYHAMVFDKRQQAYLSSVRGERNFQDREFEKIELELKKSQNAVRRMFLSLYLKYLSVQKATVQSEAAVVYPPEIYRANYKALMRGVTWLGPTTNRTLLMVSSLALHPEWFCWGVLIPGNLYLMFILAWQKNVASNLNEAAVAASRTAL